MQLAGVPDCGPRHPQVLFDRTKIYVRDCKFSERGVRCFSLSPRGNFMDCEQEQLRGGSDLLDRVTGDDVRVWRGGVGNFRGGFGKPRVWEGIEGGAGEKTGGVWGAVGSVSP